MHFSSKFGLIILMLGLAALPAAAEMQSQEIEQIRKDILKAIKRNESSAEVQHYFDEGLLLMRQSKFDEAIDKFQKALAKDPEQPNIIGNMGNAYAELEKYEEALNLYKKAIAMEPDEAALYTNMGVILSKMGKDAESQQAFKMAADLNPAASARNIYNIGATLVNNSKTAEAMDAFKKAIAADPGFAEAYYQLGVCQAGTPETMPEAILNLQQYIQIGQKQERVEMAKQIISIIQQSLKNEKNENFR